MRDSQPNTPPASPPLLLLLAISLVRILLLNTMPGRAEMMISFLLLVVVLSIVGV